MIIHTPTVTPIQDRLHAGRFHVQGKPFEGMNETLAFRLPDRGLVTRDPYRGCL